jgi:hypothetical protein
LEDRDAEAGLKESEMEGTGQDRRNWECGQVTILLAIAFERETVHGPGTNIGKDASEKEPADWEQRKKPLNVRTVVPDA